MKHVKSDFRYFAIVISSLPTEKDLVFEDEELEQLLEENSTQTQKEHAHALGVTQQAISHRY